MNERSPDALEHGTQIKVEMVVPTVEEVQELFLPVGGIDYDPKHDRLFQGPTKSLLLFFKPDNEIGTFIISRNEKEKQGEHYRGETTELYRQVALFIQNHANKTGQEWIYDLISENQNMLAWARTAGQQLFAWDEVMRVSHTVDGEPRGYLFRKTFRPEATA